jgi:hypothetical protein
VGIGSDQISDRDVSGRRGTPRAEPRDQGEGNGLRYVNASPEHDQYCVAGHRFEEDRRVVPPHDRAMIPLS